MEVQEIELKDLDAEAFIAEHTAGFDAFVSELREQAWEPLEAASCAPVLSVV